MFKSILICFVIVISNVAVTPCWEKQQVWGYIPIINRWGIICFVICEFHMQHTHSTHRCIKTHVILYLWKTSFCLFFFFLFSNKVGSWHFKTTIIVAKAFWAALRGQQQSSNWTRMEAEVKIKSETVQALPLYLLKFTPM